MKHHCPKHGMTDCYLKGWDTILTCRKCEAEKKSHFAAASLILFAIVISMVAATLNPTSKSEIDGLIGVENNTFTFPSGADVFDPQWAGETINLESCTSAGSKEQQVFINISEDTSVVYNAHAAGTYCWQAVEKTDTAKLARMANWWMRSLTIAGYRASVTANP